MWLLQLCTKLHTRYIGKYMYKYVAAPIATYQVGKYMYMYKYVHADQP